MYVYIKLNQLLYHFKVQDY